MDNIIRLSLKDIDNICILDMLCFPKDHTERKQWIELLEDERTIFYAICENEMIKAQIGIYNWKGENDYIKIMTIGTHPEYRSKGYAHKLMQHVIDEMTKDEMYIFKAETRETNFKMQKVFDDFGYKITSKVEGYYDNPSETAYKYSLEI